MREDYYFKVQVSWKDNRGNRYPSKRCPVKAQSSDGFTREFYTDENGVVTVYGASQCYRYLYLNGKCYEGRYEDGGFYPFIIPG